MKYVIELNVEELTVLTDGLDVLSHVAQQNGEFLKASTLQKVHDKLKKPSESYGNLISAAYLALKLLKSSSLTTDSTEAVRELRVALDELS